MEVVVTVVVVVEALQPPDPDTKEPSIQTCLLVNGKGVDYIINSDEELIFVRNRQRVPGRTFLPPRTPTTNETGTSPVTALISHS